MKNAWMKTLTGASVAGILMIGSASAGYNDLIKALEAKGTLTAEEAADLKAAEVKPDKKDATSLKIKGRMQFQAGYVDQENDVNSGDWSTFEVRRARIGVSAKFPGDVKATVEANVKPGDSSVSSATIHWTGNDLYNINAGFDKPASGLEENTSSASILTVERSNLTNTLIGGTDSIGIWVNGDASGFFYQLGLFNGEDVDSSRNTSNVEAEYMFNARGGFETDLSEDSSIMAMVSYLQSDDPNGALGYDDTTSIALHYEAGVFDLRAEYLVGTSDDGDTDGFYIMPSMKVSKSGEVVLRYEYMESDDSSGIRAQSRYARRTDVVVIGTDEEGEDIKADKGDEFSAIYLGYNHYFQKYHKVMFGIEWSELDNTKAGKLDSTTLFAAWRTRF